MLEESLEGKKLETAIYDSFSFVQLQGKPCTKKAFLKENPYEKAFFSTMLALKKALKGKK